MTFGEWHWIQLHVKNGDPGAAEVQAFVDGHLDYEQNTIGVQKAPIQFLEAGIMHMNSVGPAATTITDSIRLGQSYQLPSATSDAAAPTDVTLTSPTSGATISGGTASLAATATDNYAVQRVDFLIDGAVVASDDIAPFAQTVDVVPYDTGTHAFAVRAYDTSGLSTTSAPTSVTIDNSGPTIISPAVAPTAISPNADGYQDTATITYSTAATCEHKVDVLNTSDVAVKTFSLYTSYPAGDFTVIWNGKDDSAVPVPDGQYTVRIRTRDALSRVTTATVPVTVDRVLDFTLRTPATISPNGDTFFDTTAISYHLNGSATVTVAVEDLAGAVVRTVQAATPQSAGDYSGIVWDGKNDSSVVVPDGQYTIRITAVSALGSIDVNTRYLTTPRLVTVDTTAPTITLDSITPQSWEPAGGVLSVTFTPSEAGDAIVKIYEGTGSTGAVKTIDQTIAVAGQTSVTWDGTTDAGPMVSPGTYTARVYYADKVANKATTYPVSGQFTVGGVSSIAVTSPTDGSSYEPGAALPVTWAPDFAVSTGQFSIWVVSSGGASYGGDIVAADGSASYTAHPAITAAPGTGYVARVYYRATPAMSWALYGQSAGTFAISYVFNSITVSAPSGSSSQAQGSDLPVAWTTNQAANTGEFGIWLVSPGGTWSLGKLVAAKDTTSYDESVTLNLPVADGYQLYVYYRASAGDPWSIYGLAPGTVDVTASAIFNRITVSAPSGSTSQAQGSDLPVAWTTNQAANTGEFGIWLVSPGGTWSLGKLVAAKDTTSYDESVTLNLPVADGYQLYVYYRASAGDPWSIYGLAPGTVDVTASAIFNRITVSAPSGSTSQAQGSDLPVAWTTNQAANTGEFGIWLVSPGGTWSLGKLVAAKDTTSYDESVTLNLPVADGYQLYVYYRASAGDPWSIYGLAPGTVDVTASAIFNRITVSAPSGSTSQAQGSDLPVAWTTNQAANTGEFGIWLVSPGGTWSLGKLVAAKDTTSYDESVTLDLPVADGYQLYVYYRASAGDPWSIYGLAPGAVDVTGA